MYQCFLDGRYDNVDTVTRDMCPVLKSIHVSTLSSSKLGLAAGSSALSPPEMLFRTWGGGQGGHCTQRTRPRGVGADYKTVSTSQPDLSRLKTLTPARARRLGAEKTSPKKNLGA